MKHLLTLYAFTSALCCTIQATPDRFFKDRCAFLADPHFCVLPRGITKYYFNTVTSSCLPAGCGRFKSKTECENTCLYNREPTKPARNIATSVPEICKNPAHRGFCAYSASPGFAFDQISGTCYSVTISPCYNNNNQFATLHECESFCTLGQLGQPRHSDIGPLRDICSDPVDRGNCDGAAWQLFKYNPRSGKCHPIITNLCENNENRFVTYDECELACVRGWE